MAKEQVAETGLAEENLLDDVEMSITRRVNIARDDATRLANERAEKMILVKLKLRAIRDKIEQMNRRPRMGSRP